MWAVRGKRPTLSLPPTPRPLRGRQRTPGTHGPSAPNPLSWQVPDGADGADGPRPLLCAPLRVRARTRQTAITQALNLKKKECRPPRPPRPRANEFKGLGKTGVPSAAVRPVRRADTRADNHPQRKAAPAADAGTPENSCARGLGAAASTTSCRCASPGRVCVPPSAVPRLAGLASRSAAGSEAAAG